MWAYWPLPAQQGAYLLVHQELVPRLDHGHRLSSHSCVKGVLFFTATKFEAFGSTEVAKQNNDFTFARSTEAKVVQHEILVSFQKLTQLLGCPNKYRLVVCPRFLFAILYIGDINIKCSEKEHQHFLEILKSLKFEFS